MGYDKLLEQVGEFGPYQRRIYFLLCLVGFPGSYHILGYIFWAAKVDHWCDVPIPEHMRNETTWEQWRELTVPWDSTNEWDQHCKRYDFNYSEVRNLADLSNRTAVAVECHSWIYDRSQYKSTIVTEFNLVCGDKWLRSVSQSIYMAGLTLSTVFTGLLCDKFGRRPMLLFSLALLVVTSSLAAFAPNFYLFVLLRFLMAYGGTGAWQTAFVLVTELVGPSWRVFSATVIMIYWAVAYVSLACIAYFIRSHVYLQLVTSIPFCGFCVFYWLIPESPRWLLAQRKYEQAKAIIIKMAKANKQDLSEDFMNDLTLEVHAETKRSGERAQWVDMLRAPYIWKWGSVLILLWFTNSLVYYGLSLNTSSLGGNDYINCFIAGAVEIPGYILCIPVLNRFGRQRPTSLLLLSAGVSLLMSIYIPKTSNGWLWISIAMAMVGKFAITCSFSIIYVYSAELLPTTVRSLGIGMCNMMARIGGAVAPFTGDVDKSQAHIPLMLFSMLSMVCAILVFILPETKSRHLPQTIQDGAQVNRDFSVTPICCQRRSESHLSINITPIDESEKEKMSYDQLSQDDLITGTPLTSSQSTVNEKTSSDDSPSSEDILL